MKLKILSLFLITLSLFLTSPTQVYSKGPQGGPVPYIKISIDTTPVPILDYIEFKKTYFFNVTVKNQYLEISSGDPVPDEPGFNYSGKFIVKLRFTQLHSNIYIDNEEMSYTIDIPEKGESTSILVNFTCENELAMSTYQYDEWYTLEFGVSVYLGEVRLYDEGEGSEGLSFSIFIHYYGDYLAGTSVTYYVINDEKLNFIDNKMKSIYREIQAALDLFDSYKRTSHLETSFCFDNYLDEYQSMRDLYEKGEYFEATETFSIYYLTPDFTEQVYTAVLDETLVKIETQEMVTIQLEEELDAASLIIESKENRNILYLYGAAVFGVLNLLSYMLGKLRK